MTWVTFWGKLTYTGTDAAGRLCTWHCRSDTDLRLYDLSTYVACFLEM